jgi:hypothetical protein
MTCDELRPDYLPYALGAIAEPERGEIRSHLETGCQTCAAAMREVRTLSAAMGVALEGPEPSRQLRGRIMGAAGAASPARWNWFAAWVSAAATALAAAGLLVYQTRGFRAELADMQTAVGRSNASAAALRQALDLIQSPETREVTFGEGQPAPPRGRVFFQPSGVLLVASRLPAPPAEKTYEMWIIRGGKPAPAGLFSSDPRGNAIHLYRPTAPLVESDIVAVTLEAAGGVGAPTSAPVIVAKL